MPEQQATEAVQLIYLPKMAQHAKTRAFRSSLFSVSMLEYEYFHVKVSSKVHIFLYDVKSNKFLIPCWK